MEKNVKTTKSVAKSKVVAKKAASKPRVSKPTSEDIKARAYEIYVKSGYKGTEMENWLKAEKELTGKK